MQEFNDALRVQNYYPMLAHCSMPATFAFLKEDIIPRKIIGAISIIIANFILTIDRGKIKINKYFVMCFFSNFLFAVAMMINVDISDRFNLALYTIMTVFLPSIIIYLVGKHSVKELINEFNLYDKKRFLLASFCWALMLIASVRAYQLGNITIVAPILTLTSILNTIYEYLSLTLEFSYLLFSIFLSSEYLGSFF